MPSGRLLPDEIIPLPASNYLPPVKLSPADRTNPFYLRTPYPIPEKWSSRLRFHTEDSMNVMESRVAHVIQAVNRMISTGEHVSSSSLIFHSAATGSGGGGNMSSKSGFWEDTGFDASLT